MTTLLDTQIALAELEFGSQPADLVFALRIACLSANQNLEANGRLARLLAQFTGEDLPEREILLPLLATARCQLMHNHKEALYAIDRANQNGSLERFKDVPSDYSGQCLWRDDLVHLIYGMGEKTVSFALLLYRPFECELVPIDRHHLRRVGLNPERSLKRGAYLALELAIKAERDTAGFQSVPLGTYAAWLWGNQRIGDDTSETRVYPSHHNLSPCWY